MIRKLTIYEQKYPETSKLASIALLQPTQLPAVAVNGEPGLCIGGHT
ncbi:hypothetical protein [Chitinophaga sp. 212800010-3]